MLRKQHPIIAPLAALPMLALPALGQEHFMPFGQVSARVELTGLYGSHLTGETHPLATTHALTLDQHSANEDLKLNTIEASGLQQAVYGSIIEVDYHVYIDSTPFDFNAIPIPLPEIQAWEWDFDFEINSDFGARGSAELTVDFEITTPTTLTLRAISQTPFEAVIHDLTATHRFGLLGPEGTMSADGRLHQTTRLEPGNYTLTVAAAEILSDTPETYTPGEAELLLRFEAAPNQPACMPDLNADGFIDIADISIFVNAFLAGC